MGDRVGVGREDGVFVEFFASESFTPILEQNNFRNRNAISLNIQQLFAIDDLSSRSIKNNICKLFCVLAVAPFKKTFEPFAQAQVFLRSVFAVCVNRSEEFVKTFCKQSSLHPLFCKTEISDS